MAEEKTLIEQILEADANEQLELLKSIEILAIDIKTLNKEDLAKSQLESIINLLHIYRLGFDQMQINGKFAIRIRK